MSFAVIIPVRDRDMDPMSESLLELVRYFVSRSVEVILPINGPNAQAVLASPSPAGLPSVYYTEMYGGSSCNPYIARNHALRYAFSHAEYDSVLLMDADCYPCEGFFEELTRIHSPDILAAGRTTSKCPVGVSRHFDLLAAKNFECYDGFTPADHTVGCNMLIGRKVYDAIGPMRADKVSGGDGIYGIEWKKRGGTVTPAPKMHAEKTISGMSIKGIIQKQLTRASCYPPEMMSSVDTIADNLRDDAFGMMRLCYDQKSLEHYYPEFIDCLFKLSMHLGMLSQHLDAPIATRTDQPKETTVCDRNSTSSSPPVTTLSP